MNKDNENSLLGRVRFSKRVKKALSLLLATVMLLTSADLTGLGMISSHAAEAGRTYVPEITWSRSIESGNGRQVIENSAVFMNWKKGNNPKWSWSDVKNIGLGLTDEDQIWDGATTTPYFKNHASNIESATWWGTGLRRFRGEFAIPEDFTTNDFIRLKTNNQEAYASINNGNIIPINDDIFIFVYKKGQELTNDNYMKYLAFWTGVDNQNNIVVFHGVKGTPVKRYIPLNEKIPKNENGEKLPYYEQNAVNYKNQLKSSNGWAAEASLDNIGATLFKNYPAENGEFIIDIFTYDTSNNKGGGGMNKLILEFAENSEYSVEIRYWEDAVGDGGTFLAGDTRTGLKLNEKITLNKEELNKYKRGDDYLDGVQQNAPYEVIEHKGYIDVVYKSATKIQAIKKWDDGDNQDGVRPTAVKVQLYENGQKSGDPIALNSAGDWKYEWNKPLKDSEGKQIVYTVKELDAGGNPLESGSAYNDYYIVSYTQEANQTTITNTHKPEVISRTVEKAWNDGENQDGKRQSVKIQLMAGDLAKGKPVELSESNGWVYTWEDLPVKQSGKEIKYTVKEVTEIPGYTVKYSNVDGSFDKDGKVIVTNTHSPEQVTIPVEKRWVDHENAGNKRPGEITIQLYSQMEGAEKQAVGDPVTLSSSEGWKTTYSLPKYSAGKEILYTVEELSSTDGYEPPVYTTETIDSVNTLIITNKLNQEAISISGEKKWVDGGDSADRKPVEVQLYADGSPAKDIEGKPINTLTTDENSGWKYEFTNLPKYDNDRNPINYTVKEVSAIDGYTSKAEGTDLINTRSDIDAKVDIKVRKNWVDGNSEKRPASIRIELLQNSSSMTPQQILTMTGAEGWKEITFSQMPKYDRNGKLYEYTVKELDTSTPAFAQYSEPVIEAAKNDPYSFTITNTRKDINEKISLSIVKKWIDGNDMTIRPEKITIQIRRDDKRDPIYTFDMKKGTDDSDEIWNYTLGEELPMYNPYTGMPYEYTVSEAVIDGYKQAVITQPNAGNKYKAVITNAREDIDDKVSFDLEKTWVDGGDPDGTLRPDSLTFELLRDGTSLTPAVTAQMTSSDNWNKVTFGDQRRYDETTGKEYTYSVIERLAESGIDGIYTAEIKESFADKHYSFECINTRSDIKDTVDITADKTWIDGGDPNGTLRPDSITFELLQDGKAMSPAETRQMKSENGWSNITFENQPKYNPVTGGDYVYTIEEKDVDSSKYTVGISKEDGNPYHFHFINTRKDIYDTVEIEVEKKWVDGGDPDGTLRPDSLTFTLSNGKEAVASGEMKKEDGWNNISLGQHPKYDPETGALYQYSVTESGDLKNYNTPEAINTPTVKNGKYTFSFTNTMAAIGERINISVDKEWIDGNNDTKRPQSVSVTLTRTDSDNNTETIGTKEITKESNWATIFENQPGFDAGGNPYTYTVSEDSVENYILRDIVQPDKTNEYTATITNVMDSIDETVSVSAVKNWIDGGEESLRPEQITFKLLQNNNPLPVQTKSITRGEDGQWKITFDNVRKYDELGNLNRYDVVEDNVANYTPVGSAYIQPTPENRYTAQLTNMRADIDAKVNVIVNKTWIDDGNDAGRPDKIEFTLFRDGTSFGRPKSSLKSEGWPDVTFLGLPKYDATGKAYSYSIQETPVTGYKNNLPLDAIVTENDYTFSVVNTISDIDEVIDITVEKEWVDGEDVSQRPELSFTLTAEGAPLPDAQAVSIGQNKWAFKDLPKYNAETGHLYSYEVTEAFEGNYTQIGYTKPDAGNHYTAKFINKRNDMDDTIGIAVNKVWKDGDDNNRRPSEITFHLYQNGSPMTGVSPITMRKSDNWAAQSFSQVPQRDPSGFNYNYTVVEDAVDGYEHLVAQDVQPNDRNNYTATIVNRRNNVGETVDITVSKQWIDGNEEARRPQNVIFTLTQNGTPYGGTQATTASSDWKAVFRNVPKYDEDGRLYLYRIQEKEVSNYTSSVTQQPDENNHYEAVAVNTRDDIDKTVTIQVDKQWIDGNDTANRPDTVTFGLKRNDSITDETAEMTADSSWKAEFAPQPKYDETGAPYSYEVVEHVSSRYRTEITQQPTEYNNYLAKVVNTRSDITNTFSISVEKRWFDGDEEDLRPESITIGLICDGIAMGQEMNQIMTKSNGWANVTFPDLRLFDDEGNLHKYEVVEGEVENYTLLSIEQPEKANAYHAVITNVRKDIKDTINISVEKLWADNNNEDNRPETLTFELKQNGNSHVPPRTYTMTKADGWKPYTFSALPKFDEKGKTIDYSVIETDVPSNYSGSVVQEPTKENNYKAIIKNSRDDITATIDRITVEKIWKDGDNSDNLRPDEITFELLRDGTSMYPAVAATMKKADGWKPVSFENLPKFDTTTGAPYKYEIYEHPVANYSTPEIIQPTPENMYHAAVTNSRSDLNDEITVTVSKKWIDSGSNRPDELTFTLTSNEEGSEARIGTMTKESDWSDITFEHLKKYDENGFEIQYLVEETALENYSTVSIQPTSKNGYHAEFTNARADLEEIIEITASKNWVDGNDEALRPDSVTVNLLLGDNLIDTQEMTKDSGWKATFTDLAKCDESGNNYDYTVEEEPVPGYVTTDVIQPDETNHYQASFTNTFQTAAVEFDARKKLTDYTTHEALATPAGLFTFKLLEGDKELQILRNDSDGNIEFAPLTFDYRDEGEHTYKIVESKKLDDTIDPEGYHFDETEYIIRVNVEVQDDNTLSVTELYESNGEGIEKDEMIFENMYETPVNDLIIRKQLVGDSKETFQFTLTLNGAEYNGSYFIGDDEFTADEGILSIPGNKEAIVKGIPKGTEYTVTETDSKNHAVIANGEASNTITETMRSKLESAPVAEFINIPKERLAISKTRIGGSDSDVFTFNLRYSKANASDATPGDSDVGTTSNERSSSKRKNYKTLLDDTFDTDDNSLYLFKGNYDLYTRKDNGGLELQSRKSATDGKIKLKGGEIAVINNFVVDTEYEIAEVLPEDSKYRLAETSVENPFTGTIATATASDADAAVMAYALSDDFANIANFVNVAKYSDIRTRYHVLHIGADGELEDKIQGTIPDSGYDRFEVDKDLNKLGAKYFNEIYKSNGKENTYDLAAITVTKESANNKEEVVYSNTARGIGNALEDFDLTELDQNAVYKISVDFIQVRGTVILHKTGLNGAKLEGAKFQLYNSEDEMVGSVLTTDSEGKIVKENLLPGQYYFVETAAPAGYVTNNEPQEFELSSDNGYMSVAEISMENQLGTGSALLKKIDSFGNGLQGVTFSLYNADGEKINAEDLVTDVNGEIRVDGLELGSYYFTEEDALEGYVKDSTEIYFNISFDDIVKKTLVTPAPFVNKYEEDGVIELTKTDRDGSPLAGAVFDLYKVGNAVPFRSNLVTDTDGKIVVNELTIGQYYFVETKAPEGYVTPEGNHARSNTVEIKFAENIRDNQAAQITIVNDLQTGSVKLTKMNLAESETLKGAEFSLYRADGTLVKAGLVTDANGIIEYQNLPVGEYYFTETKAPSGYKLPKGDDAITYFTIKYGVQTDVLVTNSSSGGSSGGNGGGSGGGGNGGSSNTPGGPGTEIPDTQVPLANLPTAGNGSDGTIIIDDGLVPLAALPKTGDSPFKGLMALFTGMMLGLAALFGKKKKEDEQ